MRILAVGDVTSPGGLEHLRKSLWRFREENKIDFCVVNGENASFVSGITDDGAEILLRAGADVISGGNHTMHARGAAQVLEERRELLRPINFGDAVPGRGYGIFDASGYRVLVINALGTVNIEPRLDNPYTYIDRVLAEEKGKYDLAVLDIHAEATGEKLALGYAYDGRIAAIFGTHTHVPTADEQILPKGSGYISDVGMCGESGGVLGMDAETVTERMRTRMPIRFKAAAGVPTADGVIFDIDVSSGRTKSVRRVKF
jgi:metallophosphoesterase (TIGR00282 family)